LARINKDIFRLLMAKRRINRSRAYELVEEKKKQHSYAISRETAAYLVAAETGIDISRYLEESELAKVREAGGTIQPSVVLTVPKRPTARAKETDLGVTISADVKIVDPYLPKSMLEEARRMAAVYPVVYVFENSVRSLIMNVMSRRYGDKWFETKVSGKVQRRVQERIDNEDRNRWHGKRRSHPIFYTDIEDLESIIDINWADFEDYFPDQVWVKGKIDEIEMSRNTIAHNNPLEDRDITRLKIDLGDWIRQISRWAETRGEENDNG
jgi:Swt1-like HEPN